MHPVIKPLILLAIVAILISLPAESTAQIPDTFTNLKVFPKDIKKGDLIGKMRNMTIALGTRCWYCHVGEGDDLSTFDFAADDKPQKDIARLMVGMVTQINENAMKGVHEQKEADGVDSENLSVTCYTCHSGNTRPITERPR